MDNNLIPLKEWAENHGLNPMTAAQKAARGSFESAQKIGRQWFIDKDEPNTDHRVKSGKYKNWRNKKNPQQP